MFKMYFPKGIQLWGNKFLEGEIGRQTNWDWFQFSIQWTRHQDHAGLSITFEIMSFFCSVAIVDNRHWNWTKNRWYLPGEEEQEMREASASWKDT